MFAGGRSSAFSRNTEWKTLMREKRWWRLKAFLPWGQALSASTMKPLWASWNLQCHLAHRTLRETTTDGEICVWLLNMEKLDYLYLNNGTWEGKQVVPTEWMAASTQKHVSLEENDGYGYQWWISDSVPGIYEAVGHGGQRITVWPEKKYYTCDHWWRFWARWACSPSARIPKLEEALSENLEAYEQLQEKNNGGFKTLLNRNRCPLFRIWQRRSQAKHMFLSRILTTSKVSPWVFRDGRKQSSTLAWKRNSMCCRLGLIIFIAYRLGGSSDLWPLKGSGEQIMNLFSITMKSPILTTTRKAADNEKAAAMDRLKPHPPNISI